jgi:hypothetical protein
MGVDWFGVALVKQEAWRDGDDCAALRDSRGISGSW